MLINTNFIFFAIQILALVMANDPDPLQDYCVAIDMTPSPFYSNDLLCMNPGNVSPSHFRTSVLSKKGDVTANKFGFNITLTNTKNLPGSNTQGLSIARIDIGVNGIVPPHLHPRASEVAMVVKGNLLGGFVDTSNRAFTQILRPGDVFVFPKGLIHYIYNLGLEAAVLVSGLSSQNPGAQVVAQATFTTTPSIIDNVLEKAFQITGQDVQRIRKNLGG